MGQTQERTQAEIARQMGQMMIDLIAANVERQVMAEQISKLEAEKTDDA